ncbi:MULTISPECIES: ROK family protein [unclassified Streptomyces]|uniref:ROK family protein n=1 Tax=unclassified Streptomyces TaxID=2593676 RepID=UPI00036B3033|nr:MULTISPECIES: ROK family protein [unclassified Streptomyces]MYY00699.1 ROK family protein [Streptomyces sp. SID4913]
MNDAYDRGLFAGVDIGGTTTQVVLCDDDLNVLDRAETATPADRGGRAMIRAALDVLAPLLERTPGRLTGCGVGAAGVVDSATGRILVASDSFTGWAGFGVTKALEEALGVPAFLDNDVNAFLYGETSGGAVRDERDVLGITLGTGVGGALWSGGALFTGPHGAAGEIGHIPGFGDLLCSCGGRGHLETLASGRSIGARYAERTGRRLTAREVAQAAEHGDEDALAVFRAAGDGIARAIVMTAGVVDITTVVVGGGVSRAWPLLSPVVLASLAAEPPVSGHPVRLVRSGLGSDAVPVGAAARARRELAVGAPA